MLRGGVRRTSERCWTVRVTTGHLPASATRRLAIWTPARRKDAANAVGPPRILRRVTTLATSRRRGVPCTASCATAARVDEARKVHRRPARVQRHSCRHGPIQQRNGSHADRRRNRRRTSGGHRRPRRRAVRRQLVRYCSSVPSRTAVKSTNTSMDSSIIKVTRTVLLTMTILRRVSLACRRTTRAILRRRVRLRR